MTTVIAVGQFVVARLKNGLVFGDGGGGLYNVDSLYSHHGYLLAYNIAVV